MRRLRIGPSALAATLVLATAVVGTALASSASSMTLRESDLPAGFSQDFSHAIPMLQVRALQGAMVPGFIGGWQTELTRLHGLRSAIVTSSVLRYGSPRRAHAALIKTWAQIAKRTGARMFRIGVGQESRAFSYPSKLVTAYTIMWRYRGVEGVVLALGLRSEGITQPFIRQLALKQQTHMRAALG